MTDTPTGPLTLQHIRDRQAAKGLRKYGVALKDANLPKSALALHALEEAVDLLAYLHTAGLLDLDNSVCLLSIAERLLPLADHPKPLPPDVPTVPACHAHGWWWQLGSSAVILSEHRGGLIYYRPGIRGFKPVDPAHNWLGPVTLRAVRS